MMRHALTAALLTAAVSAQTVTTVINNGSTDTRYDIVILGDGYQLTEQGQFNQDVTTFLAALFQTQPYQTFAAYYNVHTVFRASLDSGADHPDVTPPIYRNTVYDASYNTGGVGRCLYIGNTTQALADAALAPATEGRVLVMVNDSRYGGCASTFAVSYNGSSMSQVQIHEMGHSVGQLADEYDYPNSTYTGSEPSQVNITTSPSGQKWSHWFGTNGISAFQGAGYYQFGLYRPRINCLMRSLGQALCNVCQENITRITNSIVQAITQPSPAQSSLTLLSGQTQTFSFSHFVPAAHLPTIEWEVDGTAVPGQTSTSYTLDTTSMTTGLHTVECSVQDNTPLVRQDPNELMRHTHTWTVAVTNASMAQLSLPAFQPSQLWVVPGMTITLATTIRNDGPATAGPFDIEYFLSEPGPWSPNDIYLGKHTVNSLIANQQSVINYQATLPWRLLPSIYYVWAIVDRANVVQELSENDNVAVSVLIGQPGGCITRLEFADPMLYPHNAASISAATGGSLHPTVVDHCAAPGTLYLIAWGASGTSPGTPLAPGLTIPLNQDAHTQIGLAAINGPWFQAFFGTLDAEGHGRATFALPPASGLWPSTGHFAGVLVDPQIGFSAVTNPVSITITP